MGRMLRCLSAVSHPHPKPSQIRVEDPYRDRHENNESATDDERSRRAHRIGYCTENETAGRKAGPRQLIDACQPAAHVIGYRHMQRDSAQADVYGVHQSEQQSKRVTEVETGN